MFQAGFYVSLVCPLVLKTKNKNKRRTRDCKAFHCTEKRRKQTPNREKEELMEITRVSRVERSKENRPPAQRKRGVSENYKANPCTEKKRKQPPNTEKKKLMEIYKYIVICIGNIIMKAATKR